MRTILAFALAVGLVVGHVAPASASELVVPPALVATKLTPKAPPGAGPFIGLWSSADAAYAVWEKGIARSTDAGASWATAKLPGVRGLDAFAAGKGWAIAAGKQEVFASSDGGASWKRGKAPTPPRGMSADELHLAGTRGVIYYEVVSHSGAAGSRKALFRSQDGGTSWTQIVLPLETYERTVGDDRDGSLWIVGPKVFRSRDLGAHFDEIACPPKPSDKWVSDVAAFGERIYFATTDTLYRSDNGGQGFDIVARAADENEDGFFELTLGSEGPDQIYALSYHALRRSNDGGRTWQLLAQSSPDGGDSGFARQLSASHGSLDAAWLYHQADSLVRIEPTPPPR